MHIIHDVSESRAIVTVGSEGSVIGMGELRAALEILWILILLLVVVVWVLLIRPIWQYATRDRNVTSLEIDESEYRYARPQSQSDHEER